MNKITKRISESALWQRLWKRLPLCVRRKKQPALSIACTAVILLLSLWTAVHCFLTSDGLFAASAESDVISASDNSGVELLPQADPEKVFVPEENYSYLNFALYPHGTSSEKRVVLDGIMPEGSSAQVVDVTRDYASPGDVRAGDENAASCQDASVIAAYEITIMDGRDEYEPAENPPIRVEIADPQITADGVTELWHIKDIGEREQIIDLTVVDGKLCFYAAGFSVYAIVTAPEPYAAELDCVTSLDDLTGSRAGDGFFLYYVRNRQNRYLTGNLNKNGALVETTISDKAAVWYLRQEDGYYRLSTSVNGQKVSVHSVSEHGIELSPDRSDRFDISPAPEANSFYFKKSDEDKWLQHSNSGDGFRYWQDNNNAVNSRLRLLFADKAQPTDDYYGLGGRRFGLMHYASGTVGSALMADEENNSLEMMSMVVRGNAKRHTLFVAEDSNISLWTFHPVSGNVYKLSTAAGGVIRYLNIGERLTLTDEAQASDITVVPRSGKVMLSAGGRTVSFGNGGFTVDAENEEKPDQWLHLVELSGLGDEDYITYSSKKVSVSEVPGGASVVLYTRAWNDTLKAYEFFAVDHDGTLYPCYERGDNIMWVGNRINTLLWNLIEYHYDDGTPNYYYELYNPYSHKFIAPQIRDGQILSDSKIGINLPGRRAHQYYTDILTWDYKHYSFAGVKSDMANDRIVSGYGTDTFYFAEIDAPVKTLTKVSTIDNNAYGITMKMIDFPDPTLQNKLLGDTGNTRRLVTPYLNDDGYPVSVRSGQSLSALFGSATPVNHLFLESIYKDSGYFEFDSCQNFATLLNESGSVTDNFTVYKELGTSDNLIRPTLRHGQFFPYDIILPGVYSVRNPENLYGAIASIYDESVGRLPESDPRKYERLHTVGNKPNYYNGMEMSARFVQTPDGKDAWGHDIVYEFTGDDDFWLYVDNELVIDLGGIHPALGGRVNFATGLVEVEGGTTNLRSLFASNFRSRYPGASAQDVNDYLAEYFDDGGTVFKDYSVHTMKIFYMERGAGASNLHMRFNLSNITPGHVMLSKEVMGSEDVDFNLVEYPYQIWYKDRVDGEEHLLRNDNGKKRVTYKHSTQEIHYKESYTPPGSQQSYDSVYFLSPDQDADIHFPANAILYRVIECGVNTEVYDRVTVNGREVKGDETGSSGRRSFDSGWISLCERPAVVFENWVNPNGLRTLHIQKKLFDEAGKPLYSADDPTTFSFRLYLSNGSDNTLKLAHMYRYYVRDPSGNLCRWDVEMQTFVSVGESDLSRLSPAQKASVTFETSMNGAISMIPAWYTVCVPSLPVGTKFRVEERAWEIPVGYRLLGYEPEPETYLVDSESGVNTGWVRANESPQMYVLNQRGWELKVNKVWSDQDVTSSHEPIYMAVYVSGNLLEGSVRVLRSPDTSLRYFFESMQMGKSIDDYEIREVQIVDPVLKENSDTVIRYTSIYPLEDYDQIPVKAVSKESGTSSEHFYTVSYLKGTVSHNADGVSGVGNARTDTVTNTRSDGIVITLYDMKTREPLQGGIFTLQNNGEMLGTYTSDANGRVNVLYDCKLEEDYTLTQTAPPDSYFGLPYPAVFSVGEDHSVTVTGNEPQWAIGRSPRRKAKAAASSIVAYIDVFNKPFTLQAVKISTRTQAPVGGAHFALYRSVSGLGGQVKDYQPMAGYEDLVCDAGGVIPKINNTLVPGTYYLTETAPPPGYRKNPQDVVFTISPLGEVTVDSDRQYGYLTATEEEDENAFTVVVPNTLEGAEASLTVTKTVTGSFGDREQAFRFTLLAEGATDTETYAWSKNGVWQADRLPSGGSFTLKHGESVTVILPQYVGITVTEENEGYESTFRLGDGPEEKATSVSFVLTEDETLQVVNSRSLLIPTGVKTNVVLAAFFLTAGLAGMGWMLIRRRKNRMKGNNA